MAAPRKEIIIRRSNKSVTIRLDKVLGSGSYAIVCKAKHGNRVCAAKLLHETLFQHYDPGTQVLLQRFKQECDLLTQVDHPNIVKFLDTTNDPQSGRLILLMELFGESLTKILEESESLSFPLQLSIINDVVSALSYLHSKDIIHRDLSSNNILLGKDQIAKVADFGMSKLTDINPRMTPLTQCPGTAPYMPPEALIKPPQYSSKLDCFSCGVIMIQLMTGNYPDPGDAHAYKDDPNYPSGRALVQFPEAERRKDDLNSIDDDHPLLPIALDCIKDRDTERPTAAEVGERLEALKVRQRDNSFNDSFTVKLKKRKDKRHNSQEKSSSESLSDYVIIDKMPLMNLGAIETWKTRQQVPQPMSLTYGSIALMGETVYVSQGYNIYRYFYGRDKWETLEPCKYKNFSMAILNGTLTTIGGINHEITNSLLSFVKRGLGWFVSSWKEDYPPMPTKRILPASVSVPGYLVVAGGRGGKGLSALAEVEVLQLSSSHWFQVSSLPLSATSPQMTFCKETFYLSTVHNGTTAVLSCAADDLFNFSSSSENDRSRQKSAWSRLANLPCTHKTSLISTPDDLLSIGNDIHRYDALSDSWSKVGNPGIPRHSAFAAVLPNKDIVVVGGEIRRQLLDVTEIGPTPC